MCIDLHFLFFTFNFAFLSSLAELPLWKHYHSFNGLVLTEIRVVLGIGYDILGQ